MLSHGGLAWSSKTESDGRRVNMQAKAKDGEFAGVVQESAAEAT